MACPGCDLSISPGPAHRSPLQSLLPGPFPSQGTGDPLEQCHLQCGSANSRLTGPSSSSLPRIPQEAQLPSVHYAEQFNSQTSLCSGPTVANPEHVRISLRWRTGRSWETSIFSSSPGISECTEIDFPTNKDFTPPNLNMRKRYSWFQF